MGVGYAVITVSAHVSRLFPEDTFWTTWPFVTKLVVYIVNLGDGVNSFWWRVVKLKLSFSQLFSLTIFCFYHGHMSHIKRYVSGVNALFNIINWGPCFTVHTHMPTMECCVSGLHGQIKWWPCFTVHTVMPMIVRFVSGLRGLISWWLCLAVRTHMPTVVCYVSGLCAGRWSDGLVLLYILICLW